jgi:class 3 adenylate cyclase
MKPRRSLVPAGFLGHSMPPETSGWFVRPRERKGGDKRMKQKFVIQVPKLEAIRRFARESEQPDLKKAFNLVKEGMAEPRVFARFPSIAAELRRGVHAECVLMMIDLSPFSRLASHLNAMEIARFLDGYYRIVVENVERAGGVVEKYIGDAVLAVFGRPFTQDGSAQVAADAIDVAQDLIIAVGEQFEGEVVGKVALSHGRCFIGHVGPDEHRELTIIGNPLTTLFRLENVCPRNAIIAPSALFVDEWRIARLVPEGVAVTRWRFIEDKQNIPDVGDNVHIGILQWKGPAGG